MPDTPSLIKKGPNGRTYQCDGFKLLYRNKGSVSGDNSSNPREIIHVLKGQLELTLGSEVSIHSNPSILDVPAKTYHKILARTDLILCVIEQ